MAVESTFSQNLDSRNRGTEPKKKLRKRRSIRVSRGSYLRQISKSSNSQFNWLSADESCETSILQQLSLGALSYSSQNYMKFTSSCDAKKESSQEGSEYDDVNSVVSSSCGSSDTVVCPSITTVSDDAAMPRHQSSVQVSDASPKSLKATRYQASPHDSESSYDGSDHSKSPHYTPSKTIYSGQKSLQILTRSSSKRSVKILFKKSGFEPKRTPVKCSQMSEDMNVERATCSSMIKDSRFPEHVELEPGQTESERLSFVKVCSYHHCSLNGHCHESPPPKKPFLRRKMQSSIPQMRVRPSSGSGPGKRPSADRKKGAKKQPMTSNAKPRAQFLRGANATIEDSNPIEIALNEISYPKEDNQESLDKFRNSFIQEEGILGATFELKERTLGCYKKRTEEDKSNTPAFGVVSEGHETTTSIDDRENSITLNGDNDNLPHTSSLKYSRMPHDQVSINGDNDSDSKSSKTNPSCITRNLLSCKMDETKEETKSNQKPNMVPASGFTPAVDSELKQQASTRESEPAVSLGVHKPQLGKGRNMSMWHLIHKHMASGLAAEGGTKPLQGADEGRQVEEAEMKTTRKSFDVSPDFSDSDVGNYNQEEETQEIEIRKLYAIKLVREAIEKILLPEVQDQLSENQSITSDTIEDQELSEKNHQEARDEGCHSENRNISGGNNIPVDLRVQVQVDDSTSALEIKKSESNLGKKSNKKSPSNWSNLKKWIILQRFTKELEKVRKLNLRKPRQLQLEMDPGAEKISLRRQTVDEKKRAEEWMLDYALQQVVNQLAPTQKRKVSLLVKAFETVVPPQQDSNIQVQDNVTSRPDDWGRSSVNVEHCETNNHDVPVGDEAEFSTDTCLKSDDLKSSSSKDLPLDQSQRDINVVELSCLKAEVSTGGSESKSKIEKTNDLSGVAGEQSYSIQCETCDSDVKSIASEEILPASAENTADNFRASTVENNRKSELEHVNLPGIDEDTNLRQNSELSTGDSVPSPKKIEKSLNTPQSFILDQIKETATVENLGSSSLEQQAPSLKVTKRESKPEPVEVQMFPPNDSPFNYKENEAGQFVLDKQNYLKVWHLVCQHVVSSVATKVGIQLLGEEDGELEDAKKLSAMETPGPRKDPPKISLDMAKVIHVPSHHQAKFSRSQVLKLVKEAVQEILSPEIQDDSSDTQSVSSEIVLEKEQSEKYHSEGAKQSLSDSTAFTEQKAREFDRSGEEECKKVESLEKFNSDPPKPKNWSKLKNLILLKRSIKAMEKSRKLKSQPQQQLPLPSDVKPEKVDLRHQMMDERSKAEQWMLDYAVQHIVTKLTSARKTRVAMLVEAFEAVVPLPEI